MGKRDYLRRFDWDEAKRRRDAGETLASIAADLGVSAVAVSRATNEELRERMLSQSYAWQDARRYPCATFGCPNDVHYITMTHGGGLCRSCAGRKANPSTAPCGTETAYTRGCRCTLCKAAAADARRLRRHDGHPPKVHNRSGYCNGCRCEICKEAQREYRREYRRRTKQA